MLSAMTGTPPDWAMPVLVGRRVRLEPMRADHIDGLVHAATEDRRTYGFTDVPATPLVLRERGADPSGSSRIVGATRFLDLGFWRPASDAGTTVHSSTTTTATTATAITVVATGAGGTAGTPPSVAEIGGTWLAASAQRTAVNTEAKLLLLGHAFDTWAALRVCLKTDARNARSRAAIDRLGARFEGVRRAHVLALDGTARDSAYYSIVRAEWPGVRAGLIARLTRF